MIHHIKKISQMNASSFFVHEQNMHYAFPMLFPMAKGIF
jgi:hypothetical protein